MSRVNARRPLDDDNPKGYQESDKDFTLNNIDLAVEMLEPAEAPVSDWLKKELAEAGAVTPVEQALYIIGRFGGIDGGHHKQWVLDQAARLLTRDKYGEWVTGQKAGEDGPDTYDWDEGIAP
jgi:hypothetical protein